MVNKIEYVEDRISSHSDSGDKLPITYWIEKENRLRDEKNRLLDNVSKLRDEKNILLAGRYVSFCQFPPSLLIYFLNYLFWKIYGSEL